MASCPVGLSEAPLTVDHADHPWSLHRAGNRHVDRELSTHLFEVLAQIRRQHAYGNLAGQSHIVAGWPHRAAQGEVAGRTMDDGVFEQGHPRTAVGQPQGRPVGQADGVPAVPGRPRCR